MIFCLIWKDMIVYEVVEVMRCLLPEAFTKHVNIMSYFNREGSKNVQSFHLISLILTILKANQQVVGIPKQLKSIIFIQACSMVKHQKILKQKLKESLLMNQLA